MAYQQSTATSIADLFSQLSSFAQANGWTEDHSDTDRLFLTKGTVSVAFRWASASPTLAAIYHHLSFIDSSTAPGNHTDDSGNGAIGSTNAALDDDRHVPLNDAGMRYWFFEDDTYIHVVVEVNGSGGKDYRHFGFGIIDKLGTWTGGEYCYGQKDDPVSTTLTDANASVLLDGLASETPTTIRRHCATVHAESLPGQTVGGKWGIAWNGSIADTGTDRGGTARENLRGGYRAGPAARTFGRYGGAPGNGLVPAYPISLWYQNRANTAQIYPLGYLPDVRGFMIKDFAEEQEITIGSDVWVIFPSRHKSIVSATHSSGYQGIAYKKVTT